VIIRIVALFASVIYSSNFVHNC